MKVYMPIIWHFQIQNPLVDLARRKYAFEKRTGGIYKTEVMSGILKFNQKYNSYFFLLLKKYLACVIFIQREKSRNSFFY